MSMYTFCDKYLRVPPRCNPCSFENAYRRIHPHFNYCSRPIILPFDDIVGSDEKKHLLWWRRPHNGTELGYMVRGYKHKASQTLRGLDDFPQHMDLVIGNVVLNKEHAVFPFHCAHSYCDVRGSLAIYTAQWREPYVFGTETPEFLTAYLRFYSTTICRHLDGERNEHGDEKEREQLEIHARGRTVSNVKTHYSHLSKHDGDAIHAGNAPALTFNQIRYATRKARKATHVKDLVDALLQLDHKSATAQLKRIEYPETPDSLSQFGFMHDLHLKPFGFSLYDPVISYILMNYTKNMYVDTSGCITNP